MSGCQPSRNNLAVYLQGVSIEPSSNITSEYFVTGTLPSSNAGKRVWSFISQGSVSTPPGSATLTLDYTEAQKQCPDIQVSFLGPINGNLIFYNEVFSAKKYMSLVSTGSVAVMTIKVPPSIIQCKGNGVHPYYFNVNLNDGTSAFTLNYDDTLYWTSNSITITDTSGGGGGCSGTCGNFVANYDSTTDPSILNVYLDSTYTVYTITATNDTSGTATFIVNNCSSSNECSTEACLSVTVTDATGSTDSNGTVPSRQPLTFLSTSGGEFIAQPTALSSFIYGTTTSPYAVATLVGTTTSSVINTMVVGAGGASYANASFSGGGGGGVSFSTLDISGTSFLQLKAGEGSSQNGNNSQYSVNSNLVVGTNTSPVALAGGGLASYYSKSSKSDVGGDSGSPQDFAGGTSITTDSYSGGGGGSYSAASGCTPGAGIIWNDCNTYGVGGGGFNSCGSTSDSPSTGNGGNASYNGESTDGQSGVIGLQYNPDEVLLTPLTYYGTATSSGTLTFTFTPEIITTTTTMFYVLVGGGGGGASSSSSVSGGGGGGGAVLGGSLEIQNSTTTATITIGAGGAKGENSTDGGNGSNSSITYNDATVSAQGGIGGNFDGHGGESGHSYVGADPSGYTGGGGGGSYAAATSSSGGAGTTSFFSSTVYGTGGNGGLVSGGEGSTATSNTGNGGGGGGYISGGVYFGGAGGSGFVEIYYNANDISLTFTPSN
jgi:hypothetical protein